MEQIISYSQNFEDIMLWRALKSVEKGFYIDVGAFSPDADSVTRLFYEKGWTGINIEPNPLFLNSLKDRRPRDLNLPFAVSETSCFKEFHISENPGLSTLSDSVASEHRQKLNLAFKKINVEVISLVDVWNRYISINSPVHFLKVDVEGSELAVLRGNDWRCNRPWIVVVEATYPMSPVECYQMWEHILLDADYLFAYADGLNRFYVSREHSHLLETFKYPPNVFDNFILSSQKHLSLKLNVLERNFEEESERARNAETAVKEMQNRLDQETDRARSAEAALQEMQNRLDQETDRARSAEAALQEMQNRLDQETDRARSAEAALQEMQNRLDRETDRARSAEVRNQILEDQIQRMVNSRSWKLTEPLRYINSKRKKILKNMSISCFIKNKIRKILKNIYYLIKRNNKINRFILKILNHFPILKRKMVKAIIGNNDLIQNSLYTYSNLNDLSQLSSRAVRIYVDLKKTIELRQKGK